MPDPQHVAGQRKNMTLKAEPLQLNAGWDSAEQDVAFGWGEGVSKADGALLFYALAGRIVFRGTGKTLIQELEARGYDLSTLTFSVRKREAA